MLHPFQRLLHCSQQDPDRLKVLLAASGPTIHVFNADDGTLITRWSHIEAAESNKTTRDRSPGSHNDEDGNEPSVKRRKLSGGEDAASDVSVEVVVEDGPSKRRKPKRKPFLIPSIMSLAATANGKHVIAVTGEDKSLRVLELLGNGTLKQLSQRVMPKRPSAVTLTHDQQTILCADKFGDVYAMALLWDPSSDSSLPSDTPGSTTNFSLAPSKHARPANKPFVPSASTSTVHTRKNLIALQSQQRQALQFASPGNDEPSATRAQLSSSTSSKPQPLSFPHQLLLGHVSLLTDLTAIALSSPRNFQGCRSYILTSDRDEHIRVSRGMPQAHIIENFCLGHGQFISRIHIPPFQQETLISGGGDDYLMVWDWINGAAKQEVRIREHADEVRKSVSATSGEGRGGTAEGKEGSGTSGGVAVLGIWSLPAPTPSVSTPTPADIPSAPLQPQQPQPGAVIVACEALPALLIFHLSRDGQLSYSATLPVEGNVLDVTIDAKRKMLFYAVDNVHKPGSTSELRQDKETGEVAAVWTGGFVYRSTASEGGDEEGQGRFERDDEDVGKLTGAINEYAAKAEEGGSVEEGALGDLLYGIEHLRKRAFEDDAEE